MPVKGKFLRPIFAKIILSHVSVVLAVSVLIALLNNSYFTQIMQKQIFSAEREILTRISGSVRMQALQYAETLWAENITNNYSMTEFFAENKNMSIMNIVNLQKELADIKGKNPETTFIAYGADLTLSKLADDDEKLMSWYKEKGLTKKDYYLVVGRFVPENSFEVMIREFMKSKSKRDFAIITNVNEKFLNELEEKLHFKGDKRIKFVGTVYDQELLKKIRENAYAYFHGHTVGGTNPSLIEALGSTDLNLLVDVGFNKEVAEDCALYWSRKPGSLAKLIDKADQMSRDEIAEMGQRAKKRVAEEYTWEKICGKYEDVFIGEKRG